MKRIIAIAFGLALFFAAQPAHAQSAIARQALLYASNSFATAADAAACDNLNHTFVPIVFHCTLTLKGYIVTESAALATSEAIAVERPEAPVPMLRAEPVPAGQTTNAAAQPNGTPHGILLSFTPGTQGSDTNALAGVDIFRCAGTCTASSSWGSSLNATPVAGSTYLDSAAGLTAGSTYSYYVSEVDTAGNQSAPSSIATVAVPSTGFPVNANAPTALTGAVQ